MSVLYYAGGSQWWCRRCKTTVRDAGDGAGRCQCTAKDSVDDTAWKHPWEPVCRKCLHIYRDTKHERGLRRLNMPFSDEKIWRLTLFGWTAEWAYGSCNTDVSKITPTAKTSEPIDDYDAHMERKRQALQRIVDSVPEDVQIAAIEELGRGDT